MIKRTNISDHIIQFSRFLRKNKFAIGPEDESSALQALSMIPYSRPDHFKNALRTTLCKSKRQLDQFDGLYLQYWTEIRKAENSKQKSVPEEKEKTKKRKQESGIEVIKKWLASHGEKDEISLSSYDSQELFTEQDFSNFKGEDLSIALRYSAELVKKLSNRKGRRFVSAKSRKLLDLKKIMRSNVGKSEELVFLQYKRRKIEKLKLVLICDVSRSMEMYSKFLIQFMYGLNQASTKIETFVFSTRLQRISKSLKHYDFPSVLEELKTSFDQWSGGTKIATSLLEFAENFSLPLLDSKTNVIILSDGWDTDEAAPTSEAMKMIRRNCSKIIWLNPLAGNPNFKPETACLKAAMPYIDQFQAANNIDDLRMLVRKLR